MYELLRYQADDGRQPFTEWLNALRDRAGRARILARLDRLESGNLGDVEAVGDGVIELRVHMGPGYRVYCGRAGLVLIVLLCGGDKGTQRSDIRHAKALWSDWQERNRQDLENR